MSHKSGSQPLCPDSTWCYVEEAHNLLLTLKNNASGWFVLKRKHVQNDIYATLLYSDMSFFGCTSQPS